MRRGAFDVLAAQGFELHFVGDGSLRSRHGHPNGADRFFGRTPTGACDSGSRDAVCGSGRFADPFGHLLSNRLADCTLTGKGLRVDSQQGAFDIVRIGDYSAKKILRSSGLERETVGDIASGTRLGNSDALSVSEQ